MTVPPTPHARSAPLKTHPIARFAAFNGNDSYRIPAGTHEVGGDGGNHHRLSQRQLKEILGRLSERDKEILTAIRKCRYLMGGQIRRLYFTDCANPAAAMRTTNRNMKKLRDYGLVDSLSRRIGGVRSGSGSYIWRITEAGERLLRLENPDGLKRRRFYEPSPHFLAHTLAVAECGVQLTELCRGSKNLELDKLEIEPECWRPYNSGGRIVSLKPDLFAITILENYEDYWFIEIDLATESPVAVLEKCRRYHEYYRSGLEQQMHGVFPLTVWIVPDEHRKTTLTDHIRQEFENQPKLFTVITPDALEPLIRQGLEGAELC